MSVGICECMLSLCVPAQVSTRCVHACACVCVCLSPWFWGPFCALFLRVLCVCLLEPPGVSLVIVVTHGVLLAESLDTTDDIQLEEVSVS